MREVLAAAHLKMCSVKHSKNILHHVKIFDLFTAGAVSVDGARAVAVGAGVSRLAEALPGPRVAPV